MLCMAVVDQECREVDLFLSEARESTSALIIGGEPGIGKTTAWRSACEAAAAAGFRVLSCRPGPAEVSLSFAVLADLLSDIGDDVLAEIPQVQREAIDAVLLRGPAGARAADGRVIGAAVRSVIERMASDSPVLVAIDDAQWLDASSREVLRFVVRRLHGRIGILAAVRTDHEHGASVGGGWIELAGRKAVKRLALQSMETGALTAVVSQRLGHSLPRPTMMRVVEISGGNPFYAIELAQVVSADSHDLRTALPDSLTSVVRSRLGQVSDDSRPVLLAAASTPAPTLNLLAAACQLTVAQAVELLETAEQRGIIEINGQRVGFTHPLLSTGVYADTPPPARRAMHKRLAANVAQPELRARHLALAATSHDAATMEALDTAAELTRRRGAAAAAADLIELAINLGGDTPVRRLGAAGQHFRAGSLIQARAHLDVVLAAGSSGDLRCTALMLLAAVEGYGDNLRGAVEALSTAVDEATDPRLRLQALTHLVPATGICGDLRTSVDLAREAVGVAEEIGDPDLRSQACAMWVDVSFLYGLGVDEEALQTALDLEQPDTGASAPFQATAVAFAIAGRTGDLANSTREMVDLQRRFTDSGSETDILWAADHAVRFLVWLGRYRDAHDAAQDAWQRAQQMGGQHGLITALSGIASAAAYLGKIDESQAAARGALDAATRLGAEFMVIAPTTTLAFIDVTLGRHDDALSALKPLLAEFDPAHDTELWVSPWLPDAIDAFCAVGRFEEAEPLARALERNGERHDRPWMLAVGARGRAMCLAAAGDIGGALDRAHQALIHHDRLPMPFERARTLLLLGQLQRRTRQKAAAAVTLDEAGTIFGTLGAALWTARTDAERQRVNVGTASNTVLTPTETHIAASAANGMTNRDIASRHFISVKTVEAVMSSIYRKLGIRSRAELGRHLDSEPAE